MKKRVLGFISVVGVLGVTALLLFSLGTNIGEVFPNIKPVPANILEFKSSGLGKFFYPKWEDTSHTKLEDPNLPNQPPAPPPPETSTPTSLPPSPQPPESPTPTISPLCNPFEGMNLSLVVLSIREDSMILPLYLKTEGDLIPGLNPPDDTLPSEYHALLRYEESNSCGLQGFEDRLYCMFTITPDMPGTLADFFLYLDDCEDPVFTQLNLSIPDLQLQCKEDLGEGDCEAAGGTMSKDRTGAPFCDCP